MGRVGLQKNGPVVSWPVFYSCQKNSCLDLLKQVGSGLGQQTLTCFAIPTSSYVSFALTLTIQILSKLEKLVMK